MKLSKKGVNWLVAPVSLVIGLSLSWVVQSEVEKNKWVVDKYTHTNEWTNRDKNWVEDYTELLSDWFPEKWTDTTDTIKWQGNDLFWSTYISWEWIGKFSAIVTILGWCFSFSNYINRRRKSNKKLEGYKKNINLLENTNWSWNLTQVDSNFNDIKMTQKWDYSKHSIQVITNPKSAKLKFQGFDKRKEVFVVSMELDPSDMLNNDGETVNTGSIHYDAEAKFINSDTLTFTAVGSDTNYSWIGYMSLHLDGKGITINYTSKTGLGDECLNSFGQAKMIREQ